MLCGLTRLVSRIKHMLFFSFSKKYRPFEHLKCHECLWCEYFDDCKKEHDYMLGLDCDTVFGVPIEEQYSWMNWMKTHKDDTYGKSVK